VKKALNSSDTPATTTEAGVTQKPKQRRKTNKLTLCLCQLNFEVSLSIVCFDHPQLDKTGLSLWMLGFGADLLWADMNRLLGFLFHQGVLDEQFLQLQQLQDHTSPNFVSEVVNIYFHESEKLLTNLRSLL
jgi:hypothetical protein